MKCLNKHSRLSYEAHRPVGNKGKVDLGRQDQETTQPSCIPWRGSPPSRSWIERDAAKLAALSKAGKQRAIEHSANRGNSHGQTDVLC